MASGSPNSTSAWSMRWGPRSKRTPLPGSARSRHALSLRCGRKRSKCDSNKHHAAKLAFPMQPLQGLEVAVPATVLVDREQSASCLPQSRRVPRLRRRSARMACRSRRRDQPAGTVWPDRKCDGVRSGDDDRRIERMASNSSRLRTIASLWISLHASSPLTLHDCSKAQAFDRRDHWRVKRAPCKSESD